MHLFRIYRYPWNVLPTVYCLSNLARPPTIGLARQCSKELSDIKIFIVKTINSAAEKSDSKSFNSSVPFYIVSKFSQSIQVLCELCMHLFNCQNKYCFTSKLVTGIVHLYKDRKNAFEDYFRRGFCRRPMFMSMLSSFFVLFQ